ncbi:hypothetical protein COP1_037776 [Malus domestica]
MRVQLESKGGVGSEFHQTSKQIHNQCCPIRKLKALSCVGVSDVLGGNVADALEDAGADDLGFVRGWRRRQGEVAVRVAIAEFFFLTWLESLPYRRWSRRWWCG